MPDLPKAIWSGTFSLFGVPLRCHVLDNGQRIIEADDVARLFEAMAEEDAVTPEQMGEELAAFARWQKGLLP